MSYTAPIKDMLFVMKELAGLEDIATLPGFEDANLDTAQAVLDESAKLCGEVLAPLNVEGDRNPSSWKDGVVTATPGFKEAFRQFADGGWQGVQHPLDAVSAERYLQLDRDGKTLWNGLASGDATRFGRSYKIENYYEALSDAIVNTVSSMLQSAPFQRALSGH